MSNIIEATNIHRKFGKGDLVAHILKGIDITVREGEFIAIMGKSGAGKSTLMYQLSALDVPTDGELLVDNVDIIGLNERERTEFRLNTLGYVFQDYALVPDLSARENVMMPLLMRNWSWADAQAKADESIDAVDMAGKYHNLPSQLSGGEQQRVAVARAIAGNPKILFADEPTANLDSVSGQQVVDLISKLHTEHNQTVVMVTHEPEYAEGCDRIIWMEDGVITDIKTRA